MEVLSQSAGATWDAGSSLPDALRSAARLEGLVRLHLPRVYRLLRHLGVLPGDIDDASQQVFLILSNRLCDVDIEHEQAFLWSTTVRIAWRWRRTRRRRKENSDDEQLARLPAQGPSPEQQLENAQAEQLLLEVLDQLPEQLREVLVLFEIEDLTLREIAQALNLPQGTVASRLRSARQRFHRAVSDLRFAAPSRRLP